MAQSHEDGKLAGSDGGANPGEQRVFQITPGRPMRESLDLVIGSRRRI